MDPNSWSAMASGNDCDPVLYSVCEDRIEVACLRQANCDNNTEKASKDECVMPSNPNSQSLHRTSRQTSCLEGLDSNKQSNRIEEIQDIERALRNIAKARIAIDLGLQEMVSNMTNDSYSHSTFSRVPEALQLRTHSTISSRSKGSYTIMPSTVFTLSDKQAVERQMNLVTKRRGAQRNPKDAVSRMKKLTRQKDEGHKRLSGCNNTVRATNSVSSKIQVPKPSRDVPLVSAESVLSVYHSRYARCPIQGISEQYVRNQRLIHVKRAVEKCLDQLAKMEMKTYSTDYGKLHRCKFTEAVQKWHSNQ